VPCQQSENHSLSNIARSTMKAFARVFVLFLATDARGIPLDWARQGRLEAARSQRKPDAMEHKPCGFLGDPQSLR
jgi:hypothetical protein